MWPAIREALRSPTLTIQDTIARRPGEAWESAARAAEDGADLIVAIGGDGTLNEAINGLMRLAPDRRPALAYVPGGTANIFARALGLPVSQTGVVDLLRHGRRRRIDVGQVNDRYYAAVAAIGFDAEVVGLATRWRRFAGSQPMHVAAVLATLSRFRPSTARITLDGRERMVDLTFLVAANTEWYGGGLRIAPGALADDGALAVVYASGLNRRETLAVITQAFSGRHLAHPKVTHGAAAEVHVECGRPMGIHADGEWLGRGPAIFRVVPGALDLLVPA